jgi:hypothetical protein
MADRCPVSGLDKRKNRGELAGHWLSHRVRLRYIVSCITAARQVLGSSVPTNLISSFRDVSWLTAPIDLMRDVRYSARPGYNLVVVIIGLPGDHGMIVELCWC